MYETMSGKRENASEAHNAELSGLGGHVDVLQHWWPIRCCGVAERGTLHRN